MQKTKQQKVFASNLFIGALVCRDEGLFIVDNIDSTANKGFVIATLCNLDTGISHSEELSTRAKVSIAEYKERSVEYLHPTEDGQSEIFFDIVSLEKVILSQDLCARKMGFIKNAVLYILVSQDSNILGIMLPRFVEIEVKSILNNAEEIDTDDDRTYIQAELETGCHINVPPFIERADTIKIDTRKRVFVQRF